MENRIAFVSVLYTCQQDPMKIQVDKQETVSENTQNKWCLYNIQGMHFCIYLSRVKVSLLLVHEWGMHQVQSVWLLEMKTSWRTFVIQCWRTRDPCPKFQIGGGGVRGTDESLLYCLALMWQLTHTQLLWNHTLFKAFALLLLLIPTKTHMLDFGLFFMYRSLVMWFTLCNIIL